MDRPIEASSSDPDRRPLGGAAPRLQAASFALALLLPLAFAWLEPDRDVSQAEKRRLATRPRLEASFDSLASFPRRFDAYFDDRMGLRLALIRADARLHIEGFGRSPSPSLVVGRAGWFFFGDESALAQARGLQRFDRAELEAWRLGLEAQRDALARDDIGFLVVFAPNKHSIYPEYLPEHLTRTNEEPALSQLVDHLRAHSDVAVLDLRPVLLEAKQERQVYHRTDTHWNDHGAYAAARAIADAVAEQLPGFVHRPPVPVKPRDETVAGMGLPRLVGLSEDYPEDVTRLVPRRSQAGVAPEFREGFERRIRRLEPFAMEVPEHGLPRIVVFRDSFANALVPYLSESYRRTLFAWSREVDPRIVRMEEPDLVILEMAERFIDRPPGPRSAGAAAGTGEGP